MISIKRGVEIGLAVALFAGVATVGFAQQSAADAIAARQAGMKTIGGGLAAVANAMKAEQPDFAAANAAAKRVQAAFVANAGLYPPGSDVAPEGKTTKAKAEIWTNTAAFKAANDRSVAASAALVTATAGTDAAAVNTALMGVRGTCGGCHSQFRN